MLASLSESLNSSKLNSFVNKIEKPAIVAAVAAVACGAFALMGTAAGAALGCMFVVAILGAGLGALDPQSSAIDGMGLGLFLGAAFAASAVALVIILQGFNSIAV